MNTAVIICAAGGSTRYAGGEDLLGSDRSKLDEDLGGRPVLQRAVELFCHRDDVGEVIVAGPHADEAFASFELRHADRLTMLGATLCRGGPTHRAESVAAALDHVPADATHVAVHDAARAITPAALIDRVFDAARNHPAVVPGVDVADTLKRVDPDPVAEPENADPLAAILGAGDASGPCPRAITETVDRTDLVGVQTPQVFDADLLRRAYAQAGYESATDDADLVQRLGERVVVVTGDPSNMKLTRRDDLRVVRALGGFKPPSDRPTHKKF
jgi:2-C-methyl-D-erythritol 4-phosphate cytidylyltransferase